MAINWNALLSTSTKAQVLAALKKIIKIESYGRGEGKWNLTELISESTSYAMVARRMIAGVNDKGVVRPELVLKGGDGLPFRVKLKVLTRQACIAAADGQGINTWDTTKMPGTNDDGELCPALDDKPKPGDVVAVKGDAITHDPITNEPLVARHRRALVQRMEAELDRPIKPDMATYYWTNYTVDKDGCITVSYDHACQLLTTRGHRLVFPKFTSGPNKKPGSRMILNWLYKEVTPDDEKKKRKPKDKPHVVDSTAAVN